MLISMNGRFTLRALVFSLHRCTVCSIFCVINTLQLSVAKDKGITRFIKCVLYYTFVRCTVSAGDVPTAPMYYIRHHDISQYRIYCCESRRHSASLITEIDSL